MKAPRVHLNGTSKDELFQTALDAYMAMESAERKIQNAAPNARDYYVQAPGAYHEAAQEFRKLQEKVKAVKEELAQLVNDIDAQE